MIPLTGPEPPTGMPPRPPAAPRERGTDTKGPGLRWCSRAGVQPARHAQGECEAPTREPIPIVPAGTPPADAVPRTSDLPKAHRPARRGCFSCCFSCCVGRPAHGREQAGQRPRTGPGRALTTSLGDPAPDAGVPHRGRPRPSRGPADGQPRIRRAPPGTPTPPRPGRPGHPGGRVPANPRPRSGRPATVAPMTDTPAEPRPRHWYATGHGDPEPAPATPGIQLVGGPWTAPGWS